MNGLHIIMFIKIMIIIFLYYYYHSSSLSSYDDFIIIEPVQEIGEGGGAHRICRVYAL